MGKQAKKKEKTEGVRQKRHNPNTRGTVKNAGPIWAVREFKYRENGEEFTDIREVRVPPNTQWDPFNKQKFSRDAEEPFDSLRLDWREELMHYVASFETSGEEKVKVGSITLDEGGYLHRVYIGDNVEEPEKILFEIRSNKKLRLEKRQRRRKKG